MQIELDRNIYKYITQMDNIADTISTLLQKEEIDQETSINLTTMVKYYHSLSDNDQTYFKEYLGIKLEAFEDSIKYDFSNYKFYLYSSGKLLVGVYNYLGLIRNLLDTMKKKRHNCIFAFFYTYKDILANLSGEDKNIYGQILYEEIGKNISFYDGAEKIKIIEYGKKIQKEIIDWKFGNIQYKINEIDIEIELDRQEVSKLYKEFGFSNDLNQYLTELSEKDYYNSTDIEFAGIIATFREFFGKNIFEYGDKLSEALSIEIPTYKKDQSKIGRYREFIKQQLSLADHENEFIDNYIKILQNQGGHSMFSKKEYFRMIRNIGIEILYMLLSKLKSYHSGS